jgi:hypothetical protein
MAGRVRLANLTSPTARSRLKRGRQPHWHSVAPGKVHLGWQCFKGDKAGRWVLRRYIGNNKYRSLTLGRADDAVPPDGIIVLNFEQADAAARATVNSPQVKVRRLTVRQAMERYIDSASAPRASQ